MKTLNAIDRADCMDRVGSMDRIGGMDHTGAAADAVRADHADALSAAVLLDVNLCLFDANPNTNVTTANTTGNDLSPENKEYYDKDLIEMATAELIHDQFGQKRNIPAGNGKTIEFRQFDPLPELTTPLTEGVTPDGQSLNVSTVTATVAQYGGYVTYSDRLQLESIDPIVLEATKKISRQAGETLDGITRDALNTGSVVFFGGTVSARASLSYTDADNNCNITVDLVRRAVRYLEAQNAPKIDGYYVGIIHPNVKYDLMGDPKWQDAHKYVDPEHMYRNEIGELYGVRFVESSRAKVWEKAGAGSPKVDVYSTLILADDAYGVTEINGGGLQLIIKQLGSAGSSDPLDQRATIGWKGIKTAKILIPQYIVRLETTATP